MLSRNGIQNKNKAVQVKINR